MYLSLLKNTLYKNLNNFYYLNLLKNKLIRSKSFFLFNIIYYNSLNFKLIKYLLNTYDLELYFLKNKNLIFIYKNKLFKKHNINNLFKSINAISYIKNIDNILFKKKIKVLCNNYFFDLIYIKLNSHNKLISINYLMKLFKYGSTKYKMYIYLLSILIFYKFILIKLLLKKNESNN